jgi:hypothetical protein
MARDAQECAQIFQAVDVAPYWLRILELFWILEKCHRTALDSLDRLEVLRCCG